MNRRDSIIGLLGLAVAGCGSGKGVTRESPEICIDTIKARAQWASLKTIYRYMRPQVVRACDAAASGRGTRLPKPLDGGIALALSPEACLRVRELDQQLRLLGFEVDRAIDNPGVEPNWEQIIRVLEVVGKIASVLI